jgi:hypothetical protein
MLIAGPHRSANTQKVNQQVGHFFGAKIEHR